MTSNERIEMYLDDADKWRWRYKRNSRKISASTQGYVTKVDCIKSLEMSLRGSYSKLYETRRTKNGHAYQQGVLIAWDRTHEIHVEVTPWPEEKR